MTSTAVKAAVPELLRLHGLTPVGAAREAEEGVDNTNLVVETEEAGRVVVRVYERTEMTDVAFELETLQHLHSKGYPVPPIRRRQDGSLLSSLNEKPVAVFDFVRGTHPSALGAETWPLAGRWLAEYHLAITGFRPESRKGYDEFTELVRAHRLEEEFRALGYEDFLADLEAFERDHGARLREELPRLHQGVIHSDFRPDNLLHRSGILVAVLDFDTSYLASLVRDVAETLIIWSMPDGELIPDERVAAAILDAYQGVRPLGDGERAALESVILLACLSDAIRFLANRHEDSRPVERALDCVMYQRYRELVPRAGRLAALAGGLSGEGRGGGG